MDEVAGSAVVARAGEWRLSEEEQSQPPATEDPEAAFNLGLSLAGKGDEAGARAAFQSVIDSGDAQYSPVALRNLGVLLEGQGDEAGARTYYETTMDSSDAEQAPAAAYGLGLLLEGQGDHEGARAAFQTAIDSGHAEYAPAAARNLGVLLAGQGDAVGARAALQTAIESGDAEQAPAAAVNLGVLLAAQEDLAGARAAFQAAIDSEHEEFAPIAELLMGEQCTMGDLQARRDHRLRAAAWANPDVLLSLAELYIADGDLETARQRLSEAASAGRTDADDYLRLFPEGATGFVDDQSLRNVSAAAEAGDTDSMNMLGLHAASHSEVDLARAWWNRSAAQSDVIAPLLLCGARQGNTEG